MWEKLPRAAPIKLTDDQINEKYVRGDERIVVEANREKLPLFVQALRLPGYINLKPFYQRRQRWAVARQSLLIESFIINIPVPPVFLYEKQLNQYEVMDGQQRITAIQQFYENGFALAGLERWPELNGRTYANLPTKVRAGIDRRSISSFVLLHESAADDEEATLLRQLVFERLNTGGVKLERQEIRNAVDAGPFNDLLLELARTDAFRNAWQLPTYSAEEESRVPTELATKPFFTKMDDVEAVLRFFALRHASNYRSGMQGFLDIYTVRASRFGAESLAFLDNLFRETLDLATKIYGELIFRPFEPESGKWADRPQIAFYDVVMVGLSERISRADALVAKREAILLATRELFTTNDPGTFSGRGNTKIDIESRISKYRDMLALILG